MLCVPAHELRQQPRIGENRQSRGDASRQCEVHHTPEEARNVAARVRRKREDERRHADGECADVGDMAGQVWEWDLRQHHAERDQRGIYGFDEEQAGHAFHVGHDLASTCHHIGQMREFRIDEHHLCDGFGGGCRVAHRDAQVGLLDGERVVHAVAGHRHDMIA